MKTISPSIFFICMQLTCFSQVNSQQGSLSSNPAVTESEITNSKSVNGNSSQARYSLIIESLPDVSDPSAELSLDLSEKGIYTFKKAEGLIIPANYNLLIEDVATGNVFDLSSSEQHAFSINHPTVKRFVVRLNKTEHSSLIVSE